MKIISIIKRSILLLLPAVALLTGCNEPDPDSISVVDPVTEEPITVIFADAQSGEYSYKVLAGDWTVSSSDESWCVPQKDAGYSYGETSSIYVRDYEGTEDSRTASLTFRSGMASYVVMVSQFKNDEILSLYPSSSTINYKAQSLTFVVNTTLGWDVTTSASWVAATANTDGTVTLAVEENESSTESREATITVIIDNPDGDAISTTTATYTLTQEPRNDLYLTPTTSSYTFTADAGEVAIDLFTNIYEPAYTITAVSTTDDDWCTATYSDEEGLVVNATENISAESRTATINIIARSDNGTGNDTITASIQITQEGVGEIAIYIGQTSYVYEQAAGSYSIYYTANTTISYATTDSQWITIDPSSSNSTSFTLTENTGNSSRQGTITLTAYLGGEIVQNKITIYQNGVGDLDLQVSPDSLSFDEIGGTATIYATTNSSATEMAYSWSVPGSWITTSSSLTGSSIDIKVAENAELFEREDVVVVMLTVGDQSVAKLITVSQKCLSATPELETTTSDEE